MSSKKTQDLTMADALELFDEKASTGHVPNARTGELTSISDNMRHVIRSAVNNAVTRATGSTNLEEISYAAVSQMLPEHALLDAEEHGRSKPRVEAARVRRFIRTVDGVEPKRRRARTWNFLPAWQPLAKAMSEWEQSPAGDTRLAASLHELMDLASTQLGVTTPAGLPNRNVLQRAAMGTDITRQRFSRILRAYRVARQVVTEAQPELSGEFPDIDRAPIEWERGIRSLPVICDVADALDHEGPISQLDTLDALEHIAPIMHHALRDYLESSKAEGKSAAWEKAMVGAVSRAVASAVRVGSIDMETLAPAHLFLKKVEVQEETELSDYERAVMNEVEDLDVAQTVNRQGPLVQLLCDEMAHLSADNSPAQLKQRVARALDQDDVPFFTSAMEADLLKLKVLAEFTMHRLKTSRPEQYAAISVSADGVERYMRSTNQKRNMNSRLLNKNDGLNLMTYPLVVCLGLPAMAERVRRLQQAYYGAFARNGEDPKNPTVKDAARRFDNLLERYVVTAFYYADGLREANYTYARVGAEGVRGHMVDEHGKETDSTLTHVWPDIDPETGLVTRIRTQFSGSDHRLPRLKVKYEGKDKTFRHRIWQIRPGILDFQLFTEFLLSTRARKLEQQGLIQDAQAYSFEEDVAEHNFALFVSSSGSEHHYRKLVGGYADSHLSSLVQESLHWIATTVLGRDLPPLGSAEWKTDYYRALTGHYSRAHISSYWLSIRGKLELAQQYTNDTEQTLRDSYARVTTEQLDAEFLGEPAWRRPDFFNQVIDRIWFKGQVIDWEEESPVLQLDRPDRPPAL